MFIFPLFSQVTFSMTQPVSSEEHDNLFRATEEFKKYQENIVPETPLASEPITDIDGNQIGWYIQYEVMVVNNDSIVKNTVGLELTPIEKVSSLLTYIYTDESDETEIILTDYSKIATDKNAISKFFDVTHIIFASPCNLFVSGDKKLITKCEMIYNFLGISTKIIYLEDIGNDLFKKLDKILKENLKS